MIDETNAKYDERWTVVERVLSDLKRQRTSIDSAMAPFGASPESVVMSAFYDMERTTVDLLEMLVGDDCGNIDWFVFENNFGDSRLEAGLTNHMVPIENFKDLRRLMHISAHQCND